MDKSDEGKYTSNRFKPLISDDSVISCELSDIPFNFLASASHKSTMSSDIINVKIHTNDNVKLYTLII